MSNFGNTLEEFGPLCKFIVMGDFANIMQEFVALLHFIIVSWNMLQEYGALLQFPESRGGDLRCLFFSECTFSFSQASNDLLSRGIE
jgi:hypothetical protein